jgi:uncharacterized protein YjeT (DUF2065 family)
MPPILFATLVTQMKWTVFLVLPKINLRIVGLAGVFLGIFVFYLVIPFIRIWWHLLPVILPGIPLG